MAGSRIVMIRWMRKMRGCFNRSDLTLFLLATYVDDSRLAMRLLRDGEYFCRGEGKFVFKEEWRKGLSKEERLSHTKEQVLEAMDHQYDFLSFTIEHQGDFINGWLPTLDCEIKMFCDNLIHYRFYEKATQSPYCMRK